MKNIPAYSREMDSIVFRMTSKLTRGPFRNMVEEHKFSRDSILRRKEHMLLYEFGNLGVKSQSRTPDFTFIRYKSLRNDR